MKYTYSANDVTVEIGPAATGEIVKRRQLEYDGPGRLKSVCELTTAAGSGTCAQNGSPTGFFTSYSYDVLDNITGVTQGTQTRTYAYDGLGRMTSERNPETSQSAWSYTFDSDTTCGTSRESLNL